MSDINRSPNDASFHQVHYHTCPNCKRPYNCNCHTQPNQWKLVCTDCERARYNPAVHGGSGEKEEA